MVWLCISDTAPLKSQLKINDQIKSNQTLNSSDIKHSRLLSWPKELKYVFQQAMLKPMTSPERLRINSWRLKLELDALMS